MEYFLKKNDFKLFLGDCIEVLNSFSENSIDMIFADPPYNLSNGGFTCQSGKVASVNKGSWDQSNGLDSDFTFHFKWLNLCRKVLKNTGSLWVSGTYHSIYSCGYALKKLGYHILNDISWYKPNASPNLSCRFFTASHETLLWAKKDKKAKHTFNYDIAKYNDWSEDFIKKPNKQMRSVWSINTPRLSEKKYGKHPTQKPENLLKRIILTSTKKGDLILDPFAGSSTTGIVACRYNRKFIGIEKELEYCELSKRRFLASTLTPIYAEDKI